MEFKYMDDSIKPGPEKAPIALGKFWAFPDDTYIYKRDLSADKAKAELRIRELEDGIKNWSATRDLAKSGTVQAVLKESKKLFKSGDNVSAVWEIDNLMYQLEIRNII